MLCLLPLFLAGCANPFTDFYKDALWKQPPGTALSVPKLTGPPAVSRSYNLAESVKDMEASGYTLLGTSDFTGDVQDGQMEAQAKRVNAAVVTYSVEVLNQGKRLVPIFNYRQNPSTTTTFSAGNGMGQNIYGSATTTSEPQLQTTLVPVDSRTYEFHALFWARLAKSGN